MSLLAVLALALAAQDLPDLQEVLPLAVSFDPDQRLAARARLARSLSPSGRPSGRRISVPPRSPSWATPR